VSGVLQEDKWRLASRAALINCLTFVVIVVLIYEKQTQSLAIIMYAPLIFFAGSLLTFGLMMQSGAVLAPVAWFMLGAGIYFGLGSVAGGLRVNSYSEQMFGSPASYLTRVNLLNACSVMIVMSVALAFNRMRESARRAQSELSSAKRDIFLQKIFPYVLAVAAVGVCLKYIYFPLAGDLLIRSVIGKIHFLIPACFLMLGMLWQRISLLLKTFTLILFVLEIFNGLLASGKYQIIYTMLALALGIWMIRSSWKSILLTMGSLVLVFAIINPLIALERAHLDYDAEKNTLTSRMKILRDAAVAMLDRNGVFLTIADGRNVQVNLKDMNRLDERARAIGRRFEIASIQAYLINEYDKGSPGNTLSNFWVTFIPRIFWPQKPVVTQLGNELHKKYYNAPNQVTSSLGPSYSAEAYWNYGIMGVVLVSILLGLAIGGLTHYSMLAVSGARPEYFIIAFNVAIWACFVESWLVSTYLGEFVIFVVILFIARVVVKYSSKAITYFKTALRKTT